MCAFLVHLDRIQVIQPQTTSHVFSKEILFRLSPNSFRKAENKNDFCIGKHLRWTIVSLDFLSYHIDLSLKKDRNTLLNLLTFINKRKLNCVEVKRACLIKSHSGCQETLQTCSLTCAHFPMWFEWNNVCHGLLGMHFWRKFHKCCNCCWTSKRRISSALSN